MVPAIPEADLPLIEHIARTQGNYAAYFARFECARRAAPPTPEEQDFRRRMAAAERALLGHAPSETGAVW